MVYIIYFWKKGEAIEKYNSGIGNIWYLFFLFGCLLYITWHPDSLFNHWKYYLIVLVTFIILDSLVFLNLHVSKIGGNEMQQTKRVSGLTQGFLDQTKNKMSNLTLD